MKRIQLLAIQKTLSELVSVKNKKVAMFILKNNELIDEAIKPLKELIEPSNEYAKYDGERILACVNFADKDEQGKPMVKDEKFCIPEDKMPAFNAAIAELTEKHKAAVEEELNRPKKYNDLLNEDLNIKLKTIKVKELPNDIDYTQLHELKPLIVD